MEDNAGRMDVQFWKIRNRAGRKRPYELRWRVGTTAHSLSFTTKALAQAHQSKLLRAAKDPATEWDPATGEPASWGRAQADWFSHCVTWARAEWDHLAPNSRRSRAERLAEITLLCMLDESAKARRTRPPDAVLREALIKWAFRPGRAETSPDEIASALAWLAAHTRPVASLGDAEHVKEALAKLTKLVNGKPAAHSTLGNRRSALHAALAYAVTRKIIATNPLTGIRLTRRSFADCEVSPVEVPSVEQAERILAQVRDLPAYGSAPNRGPHLYAFFACMFYAGMRPGEVKALRADNCDLPDVGWGTLTLTGSATEAGELWTDDGTLQDQRGLKHRAVKAVRVVPIPPALVGILREHMAAFPPAADGRLFYDGPGQEIIGDRQYRRCWAKARKLALTPSEAASPVAKRPYDLRHANASLQLQAGLDPAEIAKRLGHSIRVLLTTYAHWVDNGRDAANAKMDAVWGRSSGSSIKALTSVNALEIHGPATGQDGETAAA
ncbi:integrase [Thermocatellispora tengchongensis]|uniref:Integrase n=1 Tax=Thermocatellispora tengchongensis TaxID=1073253 RepID=A0A840NW24_9ACTN|nr:site-specific integrase [Thermocatellispora tengchongensis]MBB5131009.1 integrase [Thermocatellispora tengchongensis]